MTGCEVEQAAVDYVRATLSGDRAAVRSLLAAEVRLDWGETVWTDPEEFAASCDRGIDWDDIEILDVVVDGNRAAVLYEATNRDDAVRLRTGEHLKVADGLITEAVVTYAAVPLT